jgi:lipoyl(octanoyl) transferase
VIAPASLLDLGRMDYAAAWDLQRKLVDDCIADRRPDSLLLVEHPPVFTVGRTGREAHWAGLQADGAIPLHHIERGGSVTYHGPGQVVAYPIMRLGRICAGPKPFVRLLEQAVIDTLAGWGLAGSRLDKLPGVWVADGPSAPAEKIAAVGLRIVRGVTMHGIALNVSVDLSPFGRITPCGIAGCRVTSMEAKLGRPVPVAAIKEAFAAHFARRFALRWVETEAAEQSEARAMQLEVGK